MNLISKLAVFNARQNKWEFFPITDLTQAKERAQDLGAMVYCATVKSSGQIYDLGEVMFTPKAKGKADLPLAIVV